MTVTKNRAKERAMLLRARSETPPEVKERVSEIIKNVRSEGDNAVYRYSLLFDGVDIGGEPLRVPSAEIKTALRGADPGLLRSMEVAIRRLGATQGSLMRRLKFSTALGGFSVDLSPVPLGSVGCYVPGGRARYVSTVLMTAGLAKLAGVKRVVVCTPPGRDGKISDAILAAASLCDVEEVYRVGGAQAIAALAYGTQTIRKVEKIVGPGGRYPAIAKSMVSADVDTDFFAGPTELVVVADEGSDPALVAWDLIGQAEHGEETVCGLVTLSSEVAERVRSELEMIVPTVNRRGTVEGALRGGFAAVCRDEAAAVEFVNALAPEHLEILTSKPESFAARVSGAGLKLLGPYSPCAATDYVVGTDHVIPTGGFARRRGGLSVLDFLKLDWSVKGSRRGLRRLLRPLAYLAREEGFDNHYRSVESRFVGEKKT